MKIRVLQLFCLSWTLIILTCYNVAALDLDTGFGNDGRIVVELGGYGDRANAVLVQPDGKIVVGGSSSSASDLDFMLFRMLADGSLDPDFNFDGTVTSAVGSADDEILSLALQDDGKIIAAGYSSNGTDRDFALARYNSDGSLDRSFGLEGMVVTSVGNSDDEITAIELTDDGSILVTGSATGTAGRIIVLGRYTGDGSLDTSFADSGFSFTGVGDDAQAEGIALRADQRIVVSGSYSTDNKTGLMVVGFGADGQLDETFAEKGVAVPADQNATSEGYGMALLTDDAILVAGSVGEEGKRDAALFRFTAAGTPDKGFGNNGVLVTEIGAGDDVLYDVVSIGNGFATTGYTTVENGRESLVVTYEHAHATSSGQGTEMSPSSNARLQLSALQVKASYAAYQENQKASDLVVDVLTTEFGTGVDTATALAAVSPTEMVAVGTSDQSTQGTKASVAKYSLAISTLSTLLEKGNTDILTGEPYGVTRTTAIIPVEILTGIGTVTQRGVVFDTAPNPVLKDSGNNGGSGGGDATAPVITNATPANFSTGTPVTLAISTDEKATCKYNKDTDVAYSSMTNSFSSGDSLSHSADLGSSLPEGIYTYYARCVDASGNENSTGTALSFTVAAASGSSASLLNRTLQGVGDFLVTPALAASTTSTTSTNKTAANTSNSNNTKTVFVEDGNTKDGTGIGAFSSKLENLKPGTFFYARAYAVVGGSVYYGNQVEFRTADSCFVATAAFGSIFHPYVRILRDFRDACLLNSHLGRSLVTLYYRYAPPVADVISSDGCLRFAARLLLLPVVGTAWLALQFGLRGMLLLFTVVGVCWYLVRPTILCRAER